MNTIFYKLLRANFTKLKVLMLLGTKMDLFRFLTSKVKVVSHDQTKYNQNWWRHISGRLPIEFCLVYLVGLLCLPFYIAI